MIKSLTGYRKEIEYDKTIPATMYLNSNNEEISVHYHNAFEVIMPIDGYCNIAIGGINYVLREKEILFISPGIIHCIQPGSNGRHFLLNVNTSLFREVPESDDLLKSFASFAIYDEDMELGARELMNKRMEMLWAHYCSSEPYKYFHFYASIIVLFAIAGRANLEFAQKNVDTVSEKYADKHKESLDAICSYIDSNCEKDINAHFIAEKYGFSVSHFYRLFNAYTGQTFSAYLNDQRVAMAKRMLSVNKKDPIIDIGMHSGFKSVSSFNRDFKKKTGLTPSEYRESHKEDR